MIQVTILAFEQSVASTFTGPLDVFHQAGCIWNRLHGLPEAPLFAVTLVTVDGKPFTTRTGLHVTPHCAMDESGGMDLIVIGSYGEFTPEGSREARVASWLKGHHTEGVSLASICTGAFLLAKTGLLDGKTATTHWAAADRFRTIFPLVDLQPEKILTDEGQLFCSAGLSAGVDLSLYLVEHYCGTDVARKTAKAFVCDASRTSQAPYFTFRYPKDHGDTTIRKIQGHLEQHCTKPLRSPEIAHRFGMSLRNFERRFKTATGTTPLKYQQRLRVELVRHLLETTDMSFDEVSWKSGYADSGYLRKLFVRETGLLPVEYRQKFRCTR
ncbi:GlxA family transcriptional regulator [Desulfoluna spongiiphila]|uniref:Transcriptional regulator, AraC family with amidase-like domain n=1 Tax=Desulfoluna spongiiphila TaxID=419481 RepID=A0A1G5HGK2_9BACT|nr:helix-turn-helix domain-containing protein [Desulfoluna spongiiphila]SCY62992.1 transcriptional regulator, AraC family with amidase-like domain [Desulfoluna spongiiphila]VVS93416.1 dj-1/pfpi [Desulfoluna spongiiphila]